MLFSPSLPKGFLSGDQCGMCFSLLRRNLVVDFVSEQNSPTSCVKSKCVCILGVRVIWEWMWVCNWRLHTGKLTFCFKRALLFAWLMGTSANAGMLGCVCRSEFITCWDLRCSMENVGFEKKYFTRLRVTTPFPGFILVNF